MAPPRSGSFVHLSDLHISVEELLFNLPTLPLHSKFIDTEIVKRASFWRPTTHDPARLNSLARQLLWLGQRVDSFIVSGDVATTGLKEDLDEALALFEKKARPTFHEGVSFPALGSISNRIRIVPGNHDKFDWESKMPPFWKPGGELFATKFSNHWKPHPELCGVQSSEIGTTGWLFVIGADFTLRSHKDVGGKKRRSLGRGLVHDNTLRDLRKETKRIRRTHGPVVVVWCIHFWPKKHKDSKLELLGASKLLSAAEEENVQIVISGHLHERLYCTPTNRLLLFSAGTATSLDHVGVHCFHVFRLNLKRFGKDERLQVRVYDYQWDKLDGLFRVPPKPPLEFDLEIKI